MSSDKQFQSSLDLPREVVLSAPVFSMSADEAAQR